MARVEAVDGHVFAGARCDPVVRDHRARLGLQRRVLVLLHLLHERRQTRPERRLRRRS